MPHFPVTTGGKLVAVLIKNYGYQFIKKKGSHVKLKNMARNNTIIVPVHGNRTLPIGTLRDILEHTNIDIEDIKQHL